MQACRVCMARTQAGNVQSETPLLLILLLCAADNSCLHWREEQPTACLCILAVPAAPAHALGPPEVAAGPSGLTAHAQQQGSRYLQVRCSKWQGTICLADHRGRYGSRYRLTGNVCCVS